MLRGLFRLGRKRIENQNLNEETNDPMVDIIVIGKDENWMIQKPFSQIPPTHRSKVFAFKIKTPDGKTIEKLGLLVTKLDLETNIDSPLIQKIVEEHQWNPVDVKEIHEIERLRVMKEIYKSLEIYFAGKYAKFIFEKSKKWDFFKFLEENIWWIIVLFGGLAIVLFLWKFGILGKLFGAGAKKVISNASAKVVG